MTTLPGVISYPIPPYQNLPIEPQFYQPRRFVISNITLGQTTTVTTSTVHDYVIGQLVRFIIPPIFGTSQLNEAEGYVISLPSTTSFVVDIISSQANAFIPSPYMAVITNITNTFPAVITVSTPLTGNAILITNVSGMTQINNLVGQVLAVTATTINVNIDATSYGVYSGGGLATLFAVPQNQAQILSIGDVNNGVVNTSGRTNQITYIPGSFIDISPL